MTDQHGKRVWIRISRNNLAATLLPAKDLSGVRLESQRGIQVETIEFVDAPNKGGYLLAQGFCSFTHSINLMQLPNGCASPAALRVQVSAVWCMRTPSGLKQSLERGFIGSADVVILRTRDR